MSILSQKYPVRTKVVVGFLLASVLVIGVSAITYFSIRNLLETVENLAEPNEKLSQLNGLLADVYLLDMSKTERTSDKDSVLESTLNRLKDRLDWLKIHSSDSLEEAKFEEIRLGISELMVVFAGLEEVRYILTNRNFSAEALKNVERRIRRQQEVSELQFLGKIRERDFLSEINQQNQLGRSAPEDPVDQPYIDEQGLQEELRDIVKNIEEIGSSQGLGAKIRINSDSALIALKEVIEEIYKDEKSTQNSFSELENRLIQKNKEIYSKIQEVIAAMQAQLLKEYDQQNDSAYQLTYNVSTILSVLVFLGVVGSLAFVYSILKEVKQENTYREKLEEAKSRSDQLARAKQDFLANMSHEIRNPLHVIQGYQAALEKSALGIKEKEYVGNIGFASRTLVSIVNDILDFSKLEAGQIKIDQAPFDPVQLLDSVSSFYQLKAEENKLGFVTEINIPEGLWLKGDALRLNQILNNLLSNAFKFTQKGSVALRARFEGQRLYLQVDDTGTGMSKEFQANIFKEFYQGDTSITRGFGGTGLGLAIVKKLVDLQSGKITVKSKLGLGTTVSIEMPMEISDAPVSKSKNLAESYDLRGVSVLVVDDDPVGLKLLSLLLGAKGATVVTYQGGLDWRSNFRPEKFDLAILDVQMPEVSGFDVLKTMRSMPSCRYIPAIAMTANVFADEENKIREAGFSALILKPFDERGILEEMAKILYLEKTSVQADIEKSEDQSREKGEFFIDFSDLRKFCMGDESLLLEVVSDIVQTSNNDLLKIKQALELDDQNQIREVAHQLASRLGQIKSPLAPQVRDVEIDVKNGKFIEIKASIPLLLDALHRLLEYISKYGLKDFKVKEGRVS